MEWTLMLWLETQERTSLRKKARLLLVLRERFWTDETKMELFHSWLIGKWRQVMF